ncbi:MAG: hypothetical protein KA198_05640 [Chitinophagaceae bacterium]|nr:hypothetical protein [Chitinophagaceae bacterium]
MNYNIDIHCHSSSKPFMSGIGQQSLNPFQYFPFKVEHPIYALLKKPLEKFSHIRLASQSNFDFLFAGGVKVAMVSLTPMEKAFTVLNKDHDTKIKQFIKSLLKESSSYQEGFIGSKSINALTGYSTADIDGIKRVYYDIYNDLLKQEIDYLAQFKGSKSPNGLYTVQFPNNYAELQENLKDAGNLNILLTVEGAHSFGSNRVLPDIIGGRKNTHQKDTHNVLIAVDICKHIQEVKTTSPLRIHSVGLCHHFWNGLAGHCRSMDNLMAGLLNQEEGINAPLMSAGEMVIDELAKTSSQGKTVKPITLDIKHMSPMARKNFYAYRKKNADLKNMPLLCSHTGVSMSFENLDKWIKYVKDNPLERNGRTYQDGAYFLHEQSINLCREDLVEMYHSDGLLGIQLDEKRIMGPLALKDFKERTKDTSKDERNYLYAKSIWANIFCAIDELRLAKVSDLKKAWDMFAIGSDFDGLINHLDTFESAAKMNDLKTAMSYFLLEPENIRLFYQDEANQYNLYVEDIHSLKCNYSDQEIIEKVFSQNAMRFLEKTFK